MKIARVPLALALVALAALAISGPGVRFELWSISSGFQLLKWAAYAGLAAAVLAVIALLVPKLRVRATGGHVLALVIGLGVAYLPWHWLQVARVLPPIHDVSTDLANPPVFVAILPLRAGAPNPAAYGGAAVAAEQQRGYPDIRPLVLSVPPADAYARALAAARAMGWRIVAADAAAGRIEATATTFWFGFKDDVIVRVSPVASGSRIDVRSVSRVGQSDVGTNAKRIREYLSRLAG